jgi:hypothetical protein
MGIVNKIHFPLWKLNQQPDIKKFNLCKNSVYSLAKETFRPDAIIAGRI